MIRLKPSHWIARALFYGSLLGGLGLVYYFSHEVPSEPLRVRVENELNAVMNRRVTVGHAFYNLLGEVRLTDVIVYNPPEEGFRSPFLLRAPEVYITLSVFPREGEVAEIERMHFPAPELFLERIRDRSWNTESLWRKRERRADEVRGKRFQFSIKIDQAAVRYDDGNIGDSGIVLDIARVAATYLVSGDDTGIASRMRLEEAQVPGGGSLDVTLTAAAGSAGPTVDLRLRDIDLTRVRPFYQWLRILEVDSGRGELDGQFVFRDQAFRMTGQATLHGVAFHHPLSGTRFTNETIRIPQIRGDFDVDSDVLDRVRVEWRGTNFSCAGRFSTRLARTQWADLLFTGEPARGEDIRFLVRDPRLVLAGPLRGTYRYIDQAGVKRFEVEGDLTAARAGFGAWADKPAGHPAHVRIEGPGEGVPDRIEIDLVPARVTVFPVASEREGGARIRVESMRASDLNDLVPVYRDRISKRIRIGGVFSADFAVRGDRQEGTWDFTPASLGIVGLRKPLGMPAVAVARLRTLPNDEVEIEGVAVNVGRSRFTIGGRMGLVASRLDMKGFLTVPDLAEILPRGTADTFLASARGSVSFELAYEEAGPRNDKVWGTLDLTPADIEWGYFSKRAGAPLRFSGELFPRFTGGTFEAGEGRILVRARENDVEITTDGTPGERILSLLTLAKGLEAEKITLRGPISFRYNVSRARDARPFTLTTDLTGAQVAYQGVLEKPIGVPMRLLARGARGEARILFDEGSLVLGASRFVFSGTTSTVLRGSLDLNVQGDMRATELPRLVPALQTMKAGVGGGNRTIAEALADYADPEGRIRLSWRTKGTIERPEAVVQTAAAMAEAFANSLRGLFPSPGPAPRREHTGPQRPRGSSPL